MHKLALILLTVLVLGCLVSPIIASSHSGGTDDNGGHYDSATNEYHYHHGYPAHQHTNGNCPYDFEDNTHTQSKNNISDETLLVIAVIIVIAVFLLLVIITKGKAADIFAQILFGIVLLPIHIIAGISYIIDKIKNKG